MNIQGILPKRSSAPMQDYNFNTSAPLPPLTQNAYAQGFSSHSSQLPPPLPHRSSPAGNHHQQPPPIPLPQQQFPPAQFSHPQSQSTYPQSPYISFTGATPVTYQAPQLPQPTAKRRVWVKRPYKTATTLLVGPNDIVDDLKSYIVQKYPTSLAIQFDPSELIVKIEVVNTPSPLNPFFSANSPLNPQLQALHQQQKDLTSKTDKRLSSLSAPSVLPDTCTSSLPTSINSNNNNVTKHSRLRKAGTATAFDSYFPPVSQNSASMKPPTPMQQQLLPMHNLLKPMSNIGPVSPIPISASKSSLLARRSQLDLAQFSEQVPENNQSPVSILHQQPPQPQKLPTPNAIQGQVPKTSYIVLEPDSLVWKILDQYFPDGMKMQDSLIIDTPYPVLEKGDRLPGNSAVLQPSSLSQPNPSISNLTAEFAHEMNKTPSLYAGPLSNNSNPSATPHDNNFPDPLSTNYGFQYAPPTSNKVAILGEQRLPSPRDTTRFRKSSEPNSSSTTVILFPKGTRGGSKSPALSSSVPEMTSNGSTPTPTTVSTQAATLSSTAGMPDAFKKTHKRASTGLDKLYEIRESDETLKSGGQLSPDTLRSLTSVRTAPEASTDSTGADLPDKPSNNKVSIHNAKKRGNLKLVREEPKPGINKILANVNVLVVEDNLVNQKIMARHLKSCNVKFKIASTGKEALEMWREGGFHLCFMDIQLPVMSGIEVTQEIRRLERLNMIGNFANVPQQANLKEHGELTPSDKLDLNLFRSPIIIVALTASTSATDKQNALAAGCNDYLTKPVQLKWLRNKLTEWGCMQALINYDHFRNGP